MARAFVALGFLQVTQPSQIWLVYLLTALLVVFSALFVPARSAYLTSIVDKESLGKANAWLNGSIGLVMVIGFGLGGLVTAMFGAKIAFLFNALSFFLSACLLRKGARVEAANSEYGEEIVSFWSEFTAGIQAVKTNQTVIRVFLLEIGWSIGGGAINVLISVLSHQVYGAGTTGMGLSYASLGAGTMIGSWLAARTINDNRKRMERVAGVSFLADALLHILFAWSRTPLAGDLALAGAGAAGAVGNSCIASMIAASTENRLQGRVFSLFSTIGSTLLAFSMMAAGFLNEVIGPCWLGTIGGSIILVFSAVYLMLTRLSCRVVKNAQRA
jgi:MFS family permease